MKYGCFIIGHVQGLTPDQLRIAIGINAERTYEQRLRHRAYCDWEEACRRVRTDENKFPKDDDVRPVADVVYQEGVKRDLLADCDAAIKQLRSNGNPHPTDEQIRATIILIFQAREKQAEIADWLGAEQYAKETGEILIPSEWRRPKR